MKKFFTLIPTFLFIWSCIESANPKLSQEEWQTEQSTKSSTLSNSSSNLWSSSSIFSSSNRSSSLSFSSQPSSSSFSSSSVKFNVYGQVKDSTGKAISGVWLIAGKDSTITSSSGFYSLSLPAQYTGTLYPKKEGYEFYPTQEINQLSSSQTFNFEGAPIKLIISVGSTGKNLIQPYYKFISYDQSITVTAPRDQEFIGWLVDGVSASSSLTYTLPYIRKNHSLIAVYGTP